MRQQIHARGQGGIVPSVLQGRRGRISDPVYLTAILCKASQFISGFKVDHGHARNHDGAEGILLIAQALPAYLHASHIFLVRRQMLHPLSGQYADQLTVLAIDLPRLTAKGRVDLGDTALFGQHFKIHVEHVVFRQGVHAVHGIQNKNLGIGAAERVHVGNAADEVGILSHSLPAGINMIEVRGHTALRILPRHFDGMIHNVAHTVCRQAVPLLLQLLGGVAVRPVQSHDLVHEPNAFKFRDGIMILEILGIIGHAAQRIGSREGHPPVQLVNVSHTGGLELQAFLPGMHGKIHAVLGSFIR